MPDYLQLGGVRTYYEEDAHPTATSTSRSSRRSSTA